LHLTLVTSNGRVGQVKVNNQTKQVKIWGPGKEKKKGKVYRKGASFFWLEATRRVRRDKATFGHSKTPPLVEGVRRVQKEPPDKNKGWEEGGRGFDGMGFPAQ